MKLISLALTCVAVTLIAVACTDTPTATNSPSPTGTSTPAASAPAAPADEFARAKTNYAAQCEQCHGPNGEGGPVKTPQKLIKVPSLKAPHAVRHTDEELTTIITSGEEEMPGFKDKLSAAEITELVRFVRTNFQGKS